MADKKEPTFEALISEIDKLPDDLSQDYRGRKEPKIGKSEEERGEVKVDAKPRVESKMQTTVNSLVEHNNKIQNTQNHIINQQLQADSANLDENREQTSILHQHTQHLEKMNSNMERLYLLMKRQSEKLNPKFQESAQNRVKNEVAGKKDSGSGNNLLADILGDLLDIADFGSGRRNRDKGGNKNGNKDKIKPNRQRSPGGKKGLFKSASSWAEAIRGGIGKFGGKVVSGGGSLVRRAFDAVAHTRYGRAIAGGATAVAGAAGLVNYLKDDELGSVAAMEESGRGGVHTVSTGEGDNGGVSYGRHQLSSKTGSMGEFLRSKEAAPFAEHFSGLTPGSAAFTARYKELAASNPEEFAKAQHDYITRTHYGVAAEKLAAKGIDLTTRSKAVQEMIYSTAVQYGPGGASRVIGRALGGQDLSQMSDEDILSIVQDDKNANIRTDFESSPKWWDSLSNRTQREKGRLLEYLAQEKAAKKVEDKVADVTTHAANPNQQIPLADPSMPVGIFPMVKQEGEKQPSALEQLAAQHASVESMPVAQPLPSNNSSAAAAAVGTTALLGAAAVDKGTKAVASRTGGAQRIDAIKKGEGAFDATKKVEGRLDRAKDAVKASAAKTAAGEAADATAKGIMKKSVGKVIPGLGVLFTAQDVMAIHDNPNMSEEEKKKAYTKLAGGTAGAIAGAQAGASGGAAIGAGIGAFFFGAGAVPGAAIGGVIGGIGGSVAGYFGGEYLAEEGYDAMVEDSSTAKTGADESKPKSVAASTPVLPVPVGSNLKLSDDKSKLVADKMPAAPAKAVSDAKALVSARKESIAKVDTKAATPSPVATAMPTKKAEEKEPTPPPVVISQGGSTVAVIPAEGTVKKAEASPMTADKNGDYFGNAPTTSGLAGQSLPTVDTKYANTGGTVAEASIPSNVVSTTPTSSVQPTIAQSTSIEPIRQITPEPAASLPAWSAGLAPTSAPRASSVSAPVATNDVPLTRTSYESAQAPQAHVQDSPVVQKQQRVQGSGISESNSVRPELKDVPPMVTDFGIVFLNTGLV